MIYLGADHGGFELKEKLKKWLTEWGYDFEDLGNSELDMDDDFTDYSFAVAKKVADEQDLSKSWKDRAKGILACRSGGGAVAAANKVGKIIAIETFDEKSAKHARDNNDADIITLAGDWMDDEKAKKIVKTFLETEFSDKERYVRRNKQIRGH